MVRKKFMERDSIILLDCSESKFFMTIEFNQFSRINSISISRLLFVGLLRSNASIFSSSGSRTWRIFNVEIIEILKTSIDTGVPNRYTFS